VRLTLGPTNPIINLKIKYIRDAFISFLFFIEKCLTIFLLQETAKFFLIWSHVNQRHYFYRERAGQSRWSCFVKGQKSKYYTYSVKRQILRRVH
jgi:hypothetical protein